MALQFQTSRDKAVNASRARLASGSYSENNPYRNQDYMAGYSRWNWFTDTLGLTNYAGQRAQENQLAADQWESEYRLSLEDRDYNNEANTAARMRAAGMNPDLLGVNAGQSQTANNEAGAQVAPTAGQGSFAQSMQTIGQALSMAMSVYSGVVNIQNSVFDADLTKFQGLEKGNQNDLVSLLVGRIPEDSLGDVLSHPSKLRSYVNELTSPDDNGFASTLHDWLNRSLPYRDRRIKDMANRRLLSYVGSSQFQSDVLSSIGSRSRSKVDAARVYAQENALRDLSGEDDVSSVLKDIAREMFASEKTALRASRSSDLKTIEYNNSYDATLEAQASNANNRASKQKFEIQSAMTQPLTRVMNVLARKSENGNVFASTALISFMILNNLSGGASQSVDARGRKKTDMSTGF
uniref:DNA pilot protein n=1 Tax=Dulem virus 229 TaxID=3145706 RepID=A0AAU8B8B8_9VIRU